MEQKININLDYSSKVNFAYQQNSLPVINLLNIINSSENDLADFQCIISAEPKFCKDYKADIALVRAGCEYSLSDITLELDYKFLVDLKEQVDGCFVISIVKKNKDNVEVYYSEQKPISILTYDYWPGVSVIPEILASFVTPNCLSVDKITQIAVQQLWKDIKDSAIDGYQSKNKEKTYAIIKAVYNAIKEIGIAYCNPKVSFENDGQRVEFADCLVEKKLGACLDLSLLFCSVLERCGLHPIVLVHQGHAYIGCFLIEEHFNNSIEDDLQKIRKISDLDELIVFESTMAVLGSSASFPQAIKAAKNHLMLEQKFYFALDITKARKAGIKPLPMTRNDIFESLNNLKVKNLIPNNTEQENTKKDFKEIIELEEINSGEHSRIDNWKRKLLDLTLRNRLLSFKESKQTIKLFCKDLELLEDNIAEYKSFKIKENSKKMNELANNTLSTEFLIEELNMGNLYSNLTGSELEKRLIEIFRSSHNDINEGGVNTLFLALGFLEWTDKNNDSRLAPIILLPVKLTRKSLKSGYVLSGYDADAIINVTLLEMMKQDFQLEVPGVDPLPEGDKGIDVERILQLFRQTIKDIKGWEVKEDVWLGKFSFSKFIMWKDLNDRVDELMGNPVVNHLVNNSHNDFSDNIEHIKEEDIDRHYNYEKVICPLSADSSQIAAILSAEKGKSFVLHGPPGTGKSQTITNMIAHCLANDKRVLFVSEKRAALEVVHHRLCNIGLEPFCLELHSNKSGKRDVLEQFKKAIDLSSYKTPEEWGNVACDLNELRHKLNTYVNELHKIYPNGFTPYNAFSYLVGTKKNEQIDAVENLEFQDISSITQKEYGDLIKTCENLEIHLKNLSIKELNILKHLKPFEWTPKWQKNFIKTAQNLLNKASLLDNYIKKNNSFLNINFNNITEKNCFDLLELSQTLLELPVLPNNFLALGWDDFSNSLKNVIKAGIKKDDLKKVLSSYNVEKIENLSIEDLKDNYKKASEKSFVIRWLFYGKIIKLLSQTRKIGAIKLKSKDLESELANIDDYLQCSKIIKDCDSAIIKRLGSNWNNDQTDWEKVATFIEFGETLQRIIKDLSINQSINTETLREKIGDLISKPNCLLSVNEGFKINLDRLIVAWNEYQESSEKLKSFVDFDFLEEKNNFTQNNKNICNNFLENENKLREYSLWVKTENAAINQGLHSFIKAIKLGSVHSNLSKVFKWKFLELFTEDLLSNIDTLKDFLEDEHNMSILNFKNYLDDYADLLKQYIVAKLSSQLPIARTNNAPKDTPIGILRREIEKKSRNMPVRKLLANIQSILPNLKPCMLMSPLSVAQYLPANQNSFDLVIFDEASQIPVWDAIGAIARAPQCIIVGDAKQLPPTNFFGRVNDENEFSDNDDDFDELESILDECIASGLGNFHLNWHYRSRHESLIAFSNYHYYNNKLYTFPAAKSSKIGTQFRFIENGIYDKGKTRTNKIEATILVEEVIKRLKNHDNDYKSIGIVTFSQAQQNLIENLLDDAVANNPDIEKFFNEGINEPVFVKNLENVQGDERDIIFFSICYAKDQYGVLSMNFGPLNRQGGERRLNVAVTRARQEIIVFSSILPENIDLSRTNSIAVKHLKSYLNYAKNGIKTLQNILDTPSQMEQHDSIFEEEVATYLQKKGYTIDTQVGCSGYRIDLAVVHPDHSEEYVLGIECDGATYHRSATAQDRDKLRQGVLESLGWEIYRIWSTAWWYNREKCQDELIQVIEEAINNFKNDDTISHKSPQNITETKDALFNTLEKESFDELVQRKLSECENSEEYPELNYKKSHYNQESFYNPSEKDMIQQQIDEVINKEGPIYASIAKKRVCELWGFTRTGPKINSILDGCIPAYCKMTSHEDKVIIWPKHLDHHSYDKFRYHSESNDFKRAIYDVPVEELANGMYYILNEFKQFNNQEALFRETAKLFGGSRMTSKVKKQLVLAFENLQDRDKIAR